MTLQEIIKRQAEINKRMAEIQVEANNQDTPTERMAELNGEVDNLVKERNSLIAESVKLRATAQPFEPVIPTEDGANSIERSEDIFSSKKYRTAFMKYVLRHEDSPILHQRADGTTTKTSISSVIIPTTITDKLFSKNEFAGSIFARVTKTNVNFGIQIPKSTFKPVLQWVAENGKSDRQGASTEPSIVFTGFKGEIRVPISIEAQTMAIEGFEQALVEAIIQGCEEGYDKVIVAGTGSGQPKGILTEGTYSGSTANAVTLNNVTVNDYAEWVKIYAKIPKSKKSKAVLHINETDWYAHIFGMKDENGRVVALDTVGFGGNMVPTFMGKPVVLMEDQGMSAFDEITGSATKSKSTAFAYFFDDADYYFNTNKALTYKTYIDEETDETIHKATVIADGKVADDKSLLIVCRGADATGGTPAQQQ